MVIRRIKKRDWESVYRQITTYGRGAPLSPQYDLDITCNGVDYILKVQPAEPRQIAVLQALQTATGDRRTGEKDYLLIENNALLSAFLDILLFQGLQKRRT